MSIFDDNNEVVKRAVYVFNQLSDEDKIKIVSDLNPHTFKLKQYQGIFAPLLSKIQNDISKFDEIKIGNKLLEYGLEETYARLFVSNVKKHAPTIEYQLSQLAKISDELFCKNLSGIVKDIWINHADDSKITEKFNITQEQLLCIVDITRSLVNALSRGETTKEKIREHYVLKISEKKLDTLINQVLIHSKHWSSTLLFSNTQDTYFEVQLIAKQNKEILTIMKGLIDIIREQKTRQQKT